ncbi:MAG: nitroreductase family protein, partial [Candidatus Omnitrophica bacterium]|nr:nitroreductase family protein [Candidatus Omnitrophota bacterium]
SAATQNILLTSWYFGIGSCWVAGDKKPYAENIREIVGVPLGFKLVSLIALGYPADKKDKSAVNKRLLKELIHWERF